MENIQRVASVCLQCGGLWTHDPETTTCGYYRVYCKHCNEPLLRCGGAGCNKIVRPRHNCRMVKHQSTHHTTPHEYSAEQKDEEDDIDYSSSALDNIIFEGVDNLFDESDDDEDIHDVTLSTQLFLQEALDTNRVIISARDGLLDLFQAEEYYIDEDDANGNVSDNNEVVDGLIEAMEDQDNQPIEFDLSTTNNSTASTTISPILSTSHFSYMSDDISKVFFMQQHNCDLHGGIRGIAYRAQKKTKDTTEYVSVEVARHMLSTLNILVNQSPANQEKILLHHMTILNVLPDGTNIPIKLVHDREIANRIYLQKKYSMLTNTVCPTVRMDEEGHVYISLKDALDHYFAVGIDFDLTRDHEGQTSTSPFNNTRAVQDLLANQMESVDPELKDETCYGHATPWSDSFLLRFYRQRNNSIWLYVVRICGHMIVLALGPSKINHDKLIAGYFREMDTERRGMKRYWGKPGVRKIVNTSIDFILYLADGPERNDINDTLHLGNFGKRFQWAARLDNNRMPFCNTCFRKALKIALEDNGDLELPDNILKLDCNGCMGWNFECQSNASKYDPVQEKYPSTQSQNNPHLPAPKYRTKDETHIRPVRQSYGWLVHGLRYAFHEHLYGDWNKEHTRVYLSTFAINKETRERLITAVSKAKEETTDNPDNTALVDEHDYIPALWLLLDSLAIGMDRFVETAMHLIAHGIIGSIIELLDSILKEHSLGSRFETFANRYLEDIQSFRLDWCRIKLYPKKKWLAEEEFGCGRVLLFLYGQFFTEINVNGMCDTSNLKTNIIEILQMLNSCHVMIGMIMTRDDVCKNRLDIHIKIFLQCCHRLCKSYYCSSVEEFWFTKANFVCLLNLPEQIYHKGSVRSYIESTFEAKIQRPKAVLKSSQKTQSSLQRKMQLMYKLEFIETEYESIMGINSNSSNPIGESRYIFKSFGDICQRFNSGKILFGIQSSSLMDIIFVPYETGRSTCNIVGLQRVDELHVDENGYGLYHTKLQMMPDDTHRPTSKASLDDADHFCLLLPIVRYGQEQFEHSYAIATHERLGFCPDGNQKQEPLCPILFHLRNIRDI
jgi:hypothetical protein